MASLKILSKKWALDVFSYSDLSIPFCAGSLQTHPLVSIPVSVVVAVSVTVVVFSALCASFLLELVAAADVVVLDLCLSCFCPAYL